MPVRAETRAAEVDDLRRPYEAQCGGIFRNYVTCGISKFFKSVICVSNETK
jgi:hypothetical protein